MCSLYFLSAVGWRFGDPAAIAQVFQGDVYEHESMHLYFFRVSLVVLNYKKSRFLNRFTLENRGQDVFIQRTEDA